MDQPTRMEIKSAHSNITSGTVSQFNEVGHTTSPVRRRTPQQPSIYITEFLGPTPTEAADRGGFLHTVASGGFAVPLRMERRRRWRTFRTISHPQKQTGGFASSLPNRIPARKFALSSIDIPISACTFVAAGLFSYLTGLPKQDISPSPIEII